MSLNPDGESMNVSLKKIKNNESEPYSIKNETRRWSQDNEDTTKAYHERQEEEEEDVKLMVHRKTILPFRNFGDLFHENPYPYTSLTKNPDYSRVSTAATNLPLEGPSLPEQQQKPQFRRGIHTRPPRKIEEHKLDDNQNAYRPRPTIEAVKHRKIVEEEYPEMPKPVNIAIKKSTFYENQQILPSPNSLEAKKIQTANREFGDFSKFEVGLNDYYLQVDDVAIPMVRAPKIMSEQIIQNMSLDNVCAFLKFATFFQMGIALFNKHDVPGIIKELINRALEINKEASKHFRDITKGIIFARLGIKDADGNLLETEGIEDAKPNFIDWSFIRENTISNAPAFCSEDDGIHFYTALTHWKQESAKFGYSYPLLDDDFTPFQQLFKAFLYPDLSIKYLWIFWDAYAKNILKQWQALGLEKEKPFKIGVVGNKDNCRDFFETELLKYRVPVKETMLQEDGDYLTFLLEIDEGYAYVQFQPINSDNYFTSHFLGLIYTEPNLNPGIQVFFKPELRCVYYMKNKVIETYSNCLPKYDSEAGIPLIFQEEFCSFLSKVCRSNSDSDRLFF